MLLKILTLVVIAWFVLRTARNLLRAVVHDQMNPRGPMAGQNNARQRHTGSTTSHSRPHDPASREKSGSDRPTVIHRRRQSEETRPRNEEQDVEDARFRDI